MAPETTSLQIMRQMRMCILLGTSTPTERCFPESERVQTFVIRDPTSKQAAKSARACNQCYDNTFPVVHEEQPELEEDAKRRQVGQSLITQSAPSLALPVKRFSLGPVQLDAVFEHGVEPSAASARSMLDEEFDLPVPLPHSASSSGLNSAVDGALLSPYGVGVFANASTSMLTGSPQRVQVNRRMSLQLVPAPAATSLALHTAPVTTHTAEVVGASPARKRFNLVLGAGRGGAPSPKRDAKQEVAMERSETAGRLSDLLRRGK